MLYDEEKLNARSGYRLKCRLIKYFMKGPRTYPETNRIFHETNY